MNNYAIYFSLDCQIEQEIEDADDEDDRLKDVVFWIEENVFLAAVDHRRKKYIRKLM